MDGRCSEQLLWRGSVLYGVRFMEAFARPVVVHVVMMIKS